MSESKTARKGPSQTTRAILTVAGVVLLGAVIWMITSGGCMCRLSGVSYDAKMAALERTDPKLLVYREGKAMPTGLQQPRGIALDKDGRIYTAGDYAIRVYLSDGTHRSDIRLASEPYCLAVAEDGTIYVGMQDHVEVYDRNGRRLASWSSPGNRACITSIAVSGKDVWVADAGDRVVRRYTHSGEVSGVFCAKDSAKNAPGLIVPSPYLDIAPAAGGAVWVVDPGQHLLKLYTPDGQLKRSWGKPGFAIDGFSGCCNPTHFALLPDGRFVTTEKGLPRVKIYSADGKLESVVAGREAFAADVVGLDVAADAHGRILVLDPATRSVRVFTSRKADK